MTERKSRIAEGVRGCLEPGFIVGVKLGPGMPMNSCVGRVQAADSFGLRVRLIDWLVYDFVGPDLAVPWRLIEGAYVLTEEHSIIPGQLEGWGRELSQGPKDGP